MTTISFWQSDHWKNRMMKFTQRLCKKFFRSDEHPYRIFENVIENYLQPNHILLDAGCGRSASSLLKLKDKAKKLIGVDLVNFDSKSIQNNIELINSNLENIKLKSGSVDLIISRSVLEHLENPLPTYQEIYRILKQGGHFIFLVPNLGHYTTLSSKLIPNKFHPWIIFKTEGRLEKDVFPTYYRSNNYTAIKKLAQKNGFNIISIKYLGQYPCYFMFNPILFLIATGYEKVINKFEFLRYLRGWLLVILEK